MLVAQQMFPYLINCRRFSDELSLIIVSLSMTTTNKKNLIWHRDLRVIKIAHTVVENYKITKYLF